MVKVGEIIKLRKTCKHFRIRSIPDPVLNEILDAGRRAPSSGNLQNWRFVVVDDEDKRKELADACLNQRWIAKAPIHIVICSDIRQVKRWYGRKGEFYSVQNTAAAIENMIIAATGLGVSSAWIGGFADNKVRRMLAIPDNIDIHAIIVFGYADRKIRGQPKHSIWDITYFNEWDNSQRRPLDQPAMETASKKTKRTVKKVKRVIKKTAKKLRKL